MQMNEDGQLDVRRHNIETHRERQGMTDRPVSCTSKYTSILTSPNHQSRYSQRFFRLLQSSLDHTQVVFPARRNRVFLTEGCPRNS